MFALTSPLYIFRCTDGRRYCADPEGEFPGKIEQATPTVIVWFSLPVTLVEESPLFWASLDLNVPGLGADSASGQ